MDTQEQRPRPPSSEVKLYNARAVILATVLGSLAAGVYMLFANYRQLGYPKLALWVALAGWFIYLILIVATSFFPPNSMPVALGFFVLQTAIAYGALQILQAQAIAYHEQHQGKFHSLWTAVTVALIAGGVLLIVTLLNANLLASFGVGG